MRPRSPLATWMFAAAMGGLSVTACRAAPDPAAAPEPAPPAATLPVMGQVPAVVDGQAMPSLAPMLQRVMPAVVSVHTKQRVRVNTPFGNDPRLLRMLGIPAERVSEGLGSGVIVDAANGYVLTNHHVIEGADEVLVTLSDGRTLKATFKGSDPDTDVALMQIPAQNLTAIPLADSSRLRVGDFVVAVGNPFGFNQTVTSGIVSAVGRTNLPGAGFQNFIQTDASINPGNSGGALVDLAGRLVGINTASFNLQGSQAGNIGLGFAIPVNLANDIKNQLLTNKGVVRRGSLAVETRDIDERTAAALGLSSTVGALVTEVYPGSSAAKAGLQPGDVIVAANGTRMENSAAFRNFQGLQQPNAQLTLDVLRDSKRLQLKAGLQETSGVGASLDPRLEGAVFGEVPESMRRQGLEGVRVVSVAPNSRAARSGLQGNDVIIASSSGQFSDLAGFRAGFQRAPAQLVFEVFRPETRARGRLLMQ